ALAWVSAASASRSWFRMVLRSTSTWRTRASSRCLRRSTFSVSCRLKGRCMSAESKTPLHDAGDRNQRIVFSLRPEGMFGLENFGADTTAVPTPGPGQFLSRTLYLSLDPVYRTSLQGNGDASLRLNPGDVIGGETVAQVLESRHPAYR